MIFSLLLYISLLFSFTSADDPNLMFPIPETVLSGFKHFDAPSFAKQFELNYNKDGTSYAIFSCQYTYCHAENKDGCSDLCATIGPKVNLTIVSDRISELNHSKQPVADQSTCEKECAVECGNSDCSKECPKLCSIHWSYKNRKEYEQEYYQFIIKLKDYGRSKIKPIPDSLLTGYKHLDAPALAKQLDSHYANASVASRMAAVCRYSYCHSENRDGCADLCVATGAKFDETSVIGRFLYWTEKPNADQATCEKKCSFECGDCKEECAKLCGHHWAYMNRAEYEQEYNQFMIKYVEYRRNDPRDTIKYPASLVGNYTQLDSTEFLKELDFGAPGNATYGREIKYKKLIVLCRYTYCRGWFDNKFQKSCSRKCGLKAHLWDVAAIESRIKKLAKRRKPWHKKEECVNDCQAECQKNQNCECYYFCDTYWYDPHRKQYEVDLNDFLRNLRDAGRLTKLM